MKITDNVLELFHLLRLKPGMVIGEKSIDYKTLRMYIEGYIDGLGTALGVIVRKNITLWFQKKIKQKSSTYWTDHILFYYKNKTDDEYKLILIDITEQYFRKNPDWYKT